MKQCGLSEPAEWRPQTQGMRAATLQGWSLFTPNQIIYLKGLKSTEVNRNFHLSNPHLILQYKLKISHFPAHIPQVDLQKEHI